MRAGSFFFVYSDGTFKYVGTSSEFDTAAKANSQELEGYVSVRYQTLEGTYETKYVKISITTKK